MSTAPLDALAARSGEPREKLEEWQRRGLLCPDAGLAANLERTRLIRLFLRRGFTLDDVAVFERSGWMERYVGLLVPEPTSATVGLEEAAERAGVDAAVVRRVGESTGFLYASENFDADDVAGLHGLRTALDAGFPETALLEFTRVFAEAMGRVAEVETRLFDAHIMGPLRASGADREFLMAATKASSDAALPVVEPMLLYFHRRAWQRAMREDAVGQLAMETGRTSVPAVPGQLTAAVVFVDLSSFTQLAEAMGDVHAAAVLERFRDVVYEVVYRGDGRVVKQIGDAFMLVFPHAAAAVGCALAIETRTAAEPHFPAARSGVHTGSVLYRDGDYVGASVNLAARLTAEAERHQVLVSDAARRAAGHVAGVSFASLGRRRLRGVAEEVEVWAAESSTPRAPSRAVDPVCGMELGPTDAAARLTWEGRDVAFCSQDCLRRFVASPASFTR